MNILDKIKRFFKHPEQAIRITSYEDQVGKKSPNPVKIQETEEEKRRKKEEAESKYAEKCEREWIARKELERELEEERKEQERIKKIQEEIAEQERIIRENGVKERLSLQIETLKYIHSLNKNETYLQYLKEANIYRQAVGTNIQCDICGRWDILLTDFKGQTYCQKHLPSGYRGRVVKERKVTAGRHGASIDFIKGYRKE